MTIHGFFSPGELSTKSPIRSEPECHLCKLYKGCRSPKMPIAGKGVKNVLVVGEAPGADEDDQNKPFVGRAGRLLQGALEENGLSLFYDCWVGNSLACRPPKNKIPNEKMIDWCRPQVKNAIEKLKPHVILLLGAAPVRSVIGWLWKEDPGGINRWAGYRIPSRQLNAWVIPTFHPSHVSRSKDEMKDGGVTELLWRRHLKAGLKNLERPYDPSPDNLDGRVEVLLAPDRAASRLRELAAPGVPLAFDLECNMLKPESDDSRISSCAFSDGEAAIAFPWHGAAVEASREVLSSRIPKVAWNAKYDMRFIRRHLGLWVHNVVWDGMLVAHALDNRAGTKSLKFQAFAQLGQESYEDTVKPYFKSKGSNDANRIQDAHLGDLLHYNAMDTLLTMLVCRKQAEKLGMEL